MSPDLTSAFHARHARLCVEKLGAGVGQDGTVWRTAQHTAVKFFDRSERFERERDVYQLLTRRQILRVASHNVPELILFDDELRVIEMTIVTRRLRRRQAAARDSRLRRRRDRGASSTS